MQNFEDEKYLNDLENLGKVSGKAYYRLQTINNKTNVDVSIRRLMFETIRAVKMVSWECDFKDEGRLDKDIDYLITMIAKIVQDYEIGIFWKTYDLWDTEID